MKRFLIIIITTVILTTVLGSCQKENVAKSTFTATIERHANQGEKVIFNGNGFNWAEGDNILVARQSSNNNYATGIYSANSVTEDNVATLGYLANGGADVTDDDHYSGTFYAYSPSGIYAQKTTTVNRITLPATYTTDGNGNLIDAPMYAEAGGQTRTLKFKNLCGMACIRIATPNTHTYITKIKITTDKKIQGTFDITFDGTAPTITPYGDPTEAEKTIVLNTMKNIYSTHNFYIPLPEGEYHTLIIKMYTADGKTCTKSMNQSNTLHIHRSEYTLVNLTDITLNFSGAIGAKGGYFCVSTNTKVQFSQGNLQYIANDPNNRGHHLWKFADNQYTHIFTHTLSNTSDVEEYYNSNSEELIDLFGWGTSEASGKFPHELDYVNSHFGNTANNNSDIANSIYDWGQGCAITNGGNQRGLWRTLTRQEWDNLFNRGDNTWARATVCGTSGIILFPDNWASPSDISHLSCGPNHQFESNIITDEWIKFEAAGCIFLPVTGYRNHIQQNDTWKINQTSSGFYWSSSFYSNTHAYRKTFSDSENGDCSAAYKHCGFAVRLVRNATEE